MKTQRDLNTLRCSNPACAHEADHGPVWFFSDCHPQHGFTIGYQDGNLIVDCAACGKHHDDIKVAKR